MNILRLELTAAIRLDKLITKELDTKVLECALWTGSTSVLRYIPSEDKRFHTFVANRISMLHNGSEPYQRQYISTRLNPADDTSRVLSVHHLLNDKRSIKGPEFLWEPKSMWPNCTREIGVIPESNEEV